MICGRMNLETFVTSESHKNRVLHILSKLYYEQYEIKCITPLLSNTYGLNIKKRNNGHTNIN